MTLDEMAAEVVETWTRSDPEMVALWDRNALWDRAEHLGRRAKAEAREKGASERAVLMDYISLYRQPGVPGHGEPG